MEEYIKKIGKQSLIISILLVVLGFLMACKSIEMVNIFIILFGYVMVVDGLIHFASYFKIESEYRFFSYELAQAIIDILLGFFVVSNVSSVSTVLPIIIGLWIVLDGILKVQIALNIRGVRDAQWGLMFLCSLVTIFVGFGIIFNPASSLELIVKLSGAALAISQIFSIFDDIYILNEVGKVEKAEAKATKKTK